MAARQGTLLQLVLISWMYVAAAGEASSACTPFSRDAERFSLAGLPASPRMSIHAMMKIVDTRSAEVAPAAVVVHDIVCRDSATGCCDITVFVRSQTSDAHVLRQLYADNEYGFLDSIQFEPRLVLDAGANIGLGARLFARLWPRARIISLEPDRANFAMLQLNAAMAPTVQPLNVGLWDKPAYLHMENPPDNAGKWAMQARESTQQTNDSIQAVSLQSLMTALEIGKRSFDFLKVDIEGAEATVFKDPQFLALLPAVPLVSIEVHDRYQATASQVVTSAFANLDFNQSKSGEYWVFTNAHSRALLGRRHAQLLHVPLGVASHVVLGGGVLLVVGAAAAYLAIGLLSQNGWR